MAEGITNSFPYFWFMVLKPNLVTTTSASDKNSFYTSLDKLSIFSICISLIRSSIIDCRTSISYTTPLAQNVMSGSPLGSSAITYNLCVHLSTRIESTKASVKCNVNNSLLPFMILCLQVLSFESFYVLDPHHSRSEQGARN